MGRRGRCGVSEIEKGQMAARVQALANVHFEHARRCISGIGFSRQPKRLAGAETPGFDWLNENRNLHGAHLPATWFADIILRLITLSLQGKCRVSSRR